MVNATRSEPPRAASHTDKVGVTIAKQGLAAIPPFSPADITAIRYAKIAVLIVPPCIERKDINQEVAMDFSLSEGQKMIQQTVRRFVDRELMPLESEVLQSEGKYPTGIEPERYDTLQMKARDLN